MASMATLLTLTLPPNPSHPLLLKPSLSLNRPHTQTPHFPFLSSNIPHSRLSFPLLRAVAAAKVVESDKLALGVRKRTMEVVDACGRRTTVGDVSGRAGLKLHEAQRALQALASDTHGFLEPLLLLVEVFELSKATRSVVAWKSQGVSSHGKVKVSDEGDVLYVFPRDYRAKLVGKSFAMRAELVLEKAMAGAEYFARVSFGTALIVSIIIVFTAILVAFLALASSGKKSKRKEKKSSTSSHTGSSFRMSFRSTSNIFSSCWDKCYCYWDTNSYRKRQGTDDGELKVGESFFSFVFGDGDPNLGLEEKRWKMTDEAYILPVLLRYGGRPLIDEEGNILYHFPSLQRTAYERRSPEMVGKADKFLREEKWKFSKTSIAKRAMVIGLGALNLCGVIILRGLLKYD